MAHSGPVHGGWRDFRRPAVVTVVAVVLVGVLSGLAAWPQRLAAEDWVGPLSRLAPPDWSLHGATADATPLGRRIAIARRLGRFGPAADAEALLLEGLSGDVVPALRDEILRSLARRGTAAAVAPAVAILEQASAPVGPAFLLLSAVADRPAVVATVAQLRRPQFVGQARWALLRVGSVAVFPLVEALGTEAGPAAAQVLGALGNAQAVGPLLSRLRARDRADGRDGREGLSAVDGLQRIAVLGALGRLAELGKLADAGASLRASTAEAAAALLGDASDALGRAALACLVQVATPAQLPALVGLLESPSLPVRLDALMAVARADARAAVPHLRAALAAPERPIVAAALDMIVAQPRSAWVPLLREQLSSTAIERAANALARVGAGQGLPALLKAAATMPARRPLIARAVAMALRRHAGQLADGPRAAAVQLLRALRPGARRLRLRALARDPAVVGQVRRWLVDASPSRRAAAGMAAEYLASVDSLAAPLLDAIGQETDAEAFRRMADAALRLGLVVEPAVLWPRLELEATAPEALLLLGDREARLGIHTRSVAEVLRRALRNDGPAPPRTRVAAALGLGLGRNASARTPLLAALEDPDDRVRLAAARSLRYLDADGVAADLTEYARVERSPAVHTALVEAGRPGPLLARGQELLDVRVGVQMEGKAGALLDVVLPDGRWRRVRTGDHGELIIADLPPGLADVTRLP